MIQISTAVAFGVGLGLKDGVGKASEFFAGYAWFVRRFVILLYSRLTSDKIISCSL